MPVTRESVQAVIAELPPDLQSSLSGPSFTETANAVFGAARDQGYQLTRVAADAADTNKTGALGEQQVSQCTAVVEGQSALCYPGAVHVAAALRHLWV